MNMLIRLAAPALALLTATSAAAQPPARTASTPDGYVYTFTDDAMGGGGLSPKDARLHVVTHARRDTLIRPRVQFVTEMLKSVENL